MQPITKQPLFDLGQLVATPGALTALEKAGQNAMEFLSRHVTGDWGDIPEEDRMENQHSLEHGFRLLSRYRTTVDQTTALCFLHRSQWCLLSVQKSHVINVHVQLAATGHPTFVLTDNAAHHR